VINLRSLFEGAESQIQCVIANPHEGVIHPCCWYDRDMTDQASWEPGSILVEDYRIKKTLGHGGMGTVYLVQRESDGMQFAVKTLLDQHLENQKNRQLFLRELRTWIDLPEHPHLVTCRFVRTIQGNLAIFNEYVSGGSLHNWLTEGRICTISGILDAAIQFAWGIQAAHDHGVIHQDIKPKNALMTDQGELKVTDFGLARAIGDKAVRELLMQTADPTQSMLVTSGGMTPAFCSPEQALGKKIGRRTDIWSWGVSVLQMFTGDVRWKMGFLAPMILQTLLDQNQKKLHVPMPVELADILRTCFAENFLDRWRTMDDVAGKLIKLFESITGVEYYREKPETTLIDQDRRVNFSRRNMRGVSWRDPESWLEQGLSAAGMDRDDYPHEISCEERSCMAQALADLEILDTAENLFLTCNRTETPEIRRKLAGLYADMATVYVYIKDASGALMMFDRAIKVLQKLSETFPDPGIEVELIDVIHGKAGYICHLGNAGESLQLCEEAVKRLSELEPGAEDSSLHVKLSIFFSRQAVALYELQRLDEAIISHRKSNNIREQLVEHNRSPAMLHLLAQGYMNEANALINTGEYETAETRFGEAISLAKEAVEEVPREEYILNMALLHMNRATLRVQTGDLDAAASGFERSQDIMEKMVFGQGMDIYTEYLVASYLNMANVQVEMNNPESALAYSSKAIDILERLVRLEGQKHLRHTLAICNAIKANGLVDLKRYKEAEKCFDRSVEIVRYRINQEGHFKEEGLLARFKVSRAHTLVFQHETGRAKKDLNEAVHVLERTWKNTGNPMFKQSLDDALRLLDNINPSDTKK